MFSAAQRVERFPEASALRLPVQFVLRPHAKFPRNRVEMVEQYVKLLDRAEDKDAV